MTIEMNIQPRQSGKTRKIINEMKTDDVIIVKNMSMKRDLEKQGIEPYRVISVNNLRASNELTKNIFIDEYLLFSKEERKRLHGFLNGFVYSNIKIYTTSYKLYNRDIVEFIKKRKSTMPLEFIYYNLASEFKTITVDKFEEYYYNIITEPNVEINEHLPYYYAAMDKETFETQVEGRLFKKEKE